MSRIMSNILEYNAPRFNLRFIKEYSRKELFNELRDVEEVLKEEQSKFMMRKSKMKIILELMQYRNDLQSEIWSRPEVFDPALMKMTG